MSKDTIYRETAIKAVTDLIVEDESRHLNDLEYGFNQGVSHAVSVLEDLPSADIPHVGYTGVDEDYLVSVQEVLNITAETGAIETQRRVRELAKRDRPQGEWIDKGDYAECSNCGADSGIQFDGVESVPRKTNFCPYCGAKMKGVDE